MVWRPYLSLPVLILVLVLCTTSYGADIQVELTQSGGIIHAIGWPQTLEPGETITFSLNLSEQPSKSLTLTLKENSTPNLLSFSQTQLQYGTVEQQRLVQVVAGQTTGTAIVEVIPSDTTQFSVLVLSTVVSRPATPTPTPVATTAATPTPTPTSTPTQESTATPDIPIPTVVIPTATPTPVAPIPTVNIPTATPTVTAAPVATPTPSPSTSLYCPNNCYGAGDCVQGTAPLCVCHDTDVSSPDCHPTGRDRTFPWKFPIHNRIARSFVYSSSEVAVHELRLSKSNTGAVVTIYLNDGPAGYIIAQRDRPYKLGYRVIKTGTQVTFTPNIPPVSSQSSTLKVRALDYRKDVTIDIADSEISNGHDWYFTIVRQWGFTYESTTMTGVQERSISTSYDYTLRADVQDNRDKGIRTGLIIGVVLLFILIIVLAIVWCFRHIRSKADVPKSVAAKTVAGPDKRFDSLRARHFDTVDDGNTKDTHVHRADDFSDDASASGGPEITYANFAVEDGHSHKEQRYIEDETEPSQPVGEQLAEAFGLFSRTLAFCGEHLSGGLWALCFIFAVLYVFLLYIMYTIDAVMVNISLSGLAHVASYSEVEAVITRSSGDLFLPLEILNDHWQNFRYLFWNCGGTLMYVLPFVLGAWTLLMHGVLKQYPMFRFDMGLSGGTVDSPVKRFILKLVSRFFTAVYFLVLQLLALYSGRLAEFLFLNEESCSPGDRDALQVGRVINAACIVLFLLLNFTFFTGSLPGRSVGDKVVYAILGIFRYLGLTFGVITNSLADAFHIRELAYKYDDDPTDENTQHQPLTANISRSRTLLWVALPHTLVMYKWMEAFNSPALVNTSAKSYMTSFFTRHSRPSETHIQLYFDVVHRAFLWIFHCILCALALSVGITAKGSVHVAMFVFVMLYLPVQVLTYAWELSVFLSLSERNQGDLAAVRSVRSTVTS